jgi:hypothetical protein
MKKIVNGVEIELTQDEIDEHNQRELAHERAQLEYEAVKYKHERREAYESSGASILDVVEALREHIAEGRPERLAAIQAIVDQIKIDIPKPESKVGEE